MITVADILALPSFENVEPASAPDGAGSREVRNVGIVDCPPDYNGYAVYMPGELVLTNLGFAYNDPDLAERSLLAESDVIVNHMCLTDENTRFFDADKFSKMKRKPILINLGRGLSVDEDALLEALDNGTVRSFGADVLYDETPDLANHPLVGRSDVIITPHSAFYSTTSLEDLMRLSCQNIVYYLTGEKDKVFKLVN